MPAYAVFIRDETVDPVGLEQYSANVDASFEEREVKFVADYGTIETLEGDEIEGAVILEFANMDAAGAGIAAPNIRRPHSTVSKGRGIEALSQRGCNAFQLMAAELISRRCARMGDIAMEAWVMEPVYASITGRISS